MGVAKPYYLTVRQFADGQYDEGGRAHYISHPSFASKPSNYVRAFLLLQKDLIDLFNYIEPSDTNLKTFSFRIHELLVRTCIEVEANFKAIFSLNKYKKAQDGSNLTIKDYYLINGSHFLSDYEAKLPYWTGNLMNAGRRPFDFWAKPQDPNMPWVLPWYQGYNATKHDRVNSLQNANLENLIDAFSALVILISAQYLFEDFSPAPDLLQVNSGLSDGYDAAIGDYFRILFPRHLPPKERYDFNWQILQTDKDPFEKYDYDKLATKLGI